jgi:hypothetical protein
MLPNYFILLWNNKPVGIDQNSGGYPYKTDYPGSVKYWETREKAQHYADMFIEERMIVKEIQFRIMDEN